MDATSTEILLGREDHERRRALPDTDLAPDLARLWQQSAERWSRLAGERAVESARLVERNTELVRERDRLATERDAALVSARMHDRRADANREIARALAVERHDLAAQVATLTTERDRAREAFDDADRAHTRVVEERDEARGLYDLARQDAARDRERIDALRRENDRLRAMVERQPGEAA